MKTYNNDPAQKEIFQARFAEHRRLDQVIQGTGFNGTHGCFIGCTMNKYSHESFGAHYLILKNHQLSRAFKSAAQ